MSSPRPVAPSSSTPATSVTKRMQRVQWMQRVMSVLTSGPSSLSGTARLFSSIAAVVAAVAHRLVLQVALAALVADRAIERMVDQQELHHALARLLHHRRVGDDLLPVGDRQRAGRLRLRRAGLHLDQAHAAVAGDRQALVVAEARDLDAGQLAGLQDVMPAGTSISMPSILTFGIACSSAATRPPAFRCARGCGAPSRAGNGGSGPGSARPPRRPGRRSCGPRPAW